MSSRQRHIQHAASKYKRSAPAGCVNWHLAQLGTRRTRNRSPKGARGSELLADSVEGKGRNDRQNAPEDRCWCWGVCESLRQVSKCQSVGSPSDKRQLMHQNESQGRVESRRISIALDCRDTRAHARPHVAVRRPRVEPRRRRIPGHTRSGRSTQNRSPAPNLTPAPPPVTPSQNFPNPTPSITSSPLPLQAFGHGTTIPTLDFAASPHPARSLNPEPPLRTKRVLRRNPEGKPATELWPNKATSSSFLPFPYPRRDSPPAASQSTAGEGSNPFLLTFFYPGNYIEKRAAAASPPTHGTLNPPLLRDQTHSFALHSP